MGIGRSPTVSLLQPQIPSSHPAGSNVCHSSPELVEGKNPSIAPLLLPVLFIRAIRVNPWPPLEHIRVGIAWFEGARLQPRRKSPIKYGALAPE